MTGESLLLTIAVLGGTGKEGKGLAYRWAKAGYRVLIGSRSSERAVTAASEIMELLEGSSSLVGATNLEAAQQADIVVVTVPYSAHRETLEDVKDVVKGKLLIDVTVPLVPPKLTKVQMPAAGSAAQEARKILGEDVQVTAAFQNISHELLFDEDEIDSDVLVTGTSKQARDEALTLVEAAGLTGWDAGPIENSVVVEGLASVLININKRYGSSHAGLKITGVQKKS
jgi:8-hydroxy-5-deazaflavin:NADPH oxidoreductase